MTAELLLIGQKYGGRYQVTGLIGEGGMQQVYEAHDATLSRSVALKVPKNNAAERRFRRSAKLSATVSHPNVAKTLDYFEEGDRFFLVEEHVRGETLADARLKLPVLDPSAVAHLLHRLARGLAASHHAHVVHRDLKPSNIMVDSDCQFSTIKITDFGIAKMAAEELAEGVSEATVTSSHTMMGALPYLSPEMVKTPRDASLPADVWALGAIAYELMSGAKPFGAGLTAVPGILEKPPMPWPPFVLAKPQFQPLASELHAIIVACLEKDANRRPTADALVGLCGDLCYQSATRHRGVVENYIGNGGSYGFIRIGAGGEKAFFHEDSVFGKKPTPGSSVWFAKFLGQPHDRAHPVVAMT